jgi:seryl-tRNA synthetase
VISIQLIREHPEVVKKAVLDRNSPAPIDRILELDGMRREYIQQADDLKAQRNSIGREMGKATPAHREELQTKGKTLSEAIDVFDHNLDDVEKELEALLLEIPNVPAPDVPVGADERGNVVRENVGAMREFDFDPKPHWDIGEALDIIDFERGVKLAGSRFYVLKGDGARLQRALIAFMLDLHIRKHGYTELYLPAVIREENLYKSGHLPKFRDTMYHDAEDDFWWIPTAEAQLANFHSGEILEPGTLPLKYVAFTPCFRRERMSAGRDVRGIKRGHQFDKVELFRYVLPEDSDNALEEMIDDAGDVLRSLKLPYRKLQLCTGDLDFKAAKSFDLETWAPGAGEWLEVSSCSNCTDFQARRANIRFRRERTSRPEFPHMLNASGVALPRLMATVIETYQQADGSIQVPDVLIPYFGGETAIGGRSLTAPDAGGRLQ